MTEPLAEEIAALRPLAVELSLHGATAATHDRATATPGSFDALLRGLDRLLARKVAVVLKTPLTRLNEAEMDGMRRIADERGVPWRIDPVLTPRDDGDAGPLAVPGLAGGGVAGCSGSSRPSASCPHEERAKGGTNCGLGRTTIAVDPEGNVFPCLQWRRAPLGQRARDPAPVDVGGLDRAPLRRRPWPAPRTTPWSTAGGALASFPFCPALALQHTGDPLRPDESHVEQAEAAERVRLDPR